MKNYFTCAAFVAATLLLGACGSNGDAEETTENAQTSEQTVGLKIAYVSGTRTGLYPEGTK